MNLDTEMAHTLAVKSVSTSQLDHSCMPLLEPSLAHWTKEIPSAAHMKAPET